MHSFGSVCHWLYWWYEGAVVISAVKTCCGLFIQAEIVLLKIAGTE